MGFALTGAVLVGLGCAGVLPPELEELLPPELRSVAEPVVPATPAPEEAGAEVEPAEAADGAIAEAAEPEAEAEPEEPAAEEPAPEPAPAIELPVLSSVGIAAPPGAEVASHDATNALFVHRDGNIEAVWDAYVASLDGAGWVRYRTKVPPFEGLFQLDGRLVDLRLAQAGPTVTAALSVKEPEPEAP